jgi:hypothetical protein
MPDGSTLVLNKVSEALPTEGEGLPIKGINILVIDSTTGENMLCSSVIGMGNDKFILSTEHEEYLGKVLTEDNMAYCKIEMLEEDNE